MGKKLNLNLVNKDMKSSQMLAIVLWNLWLNNGRVSSNASLIMHTTGHIYIYFLFKQLSIHMHKETSILKIIHQDFFFFFPQGEKLQNSIKCNMNLAKEISLLPLGFSKGYYLLKYPKGQITNYTL